MLLCFLAPYCLPQEGKVNSYYLDEFAHIFYAFTKHSIKKWSFLLQDRFGKIKSIFKRDSVLGGKGKTLSRDLWDIYRKAVLKWLQLLSQLFLTLAKIRKVYNVYIIFPYFCTGNDSLYWLVIWICMCMVYEYWDYSAEQARQNVSLRNQQLRKKESSSQIVIP